MRDGVRIVNAARGELARRGRAGEAVRIGKVAGAALDVFSAEPYTGALLELDNVVVTPHLAASTDGGAGPRRRDRRRAGRRRARGRARHERASTSRSSAAEDLERARRRTSRSPPSWDGSQSSSAGGHPRRIALSYYGALADHDTRLLTVAALNGAFQGRVEQAVNYVNAPVIAAERGIEVTEERSAKSRDYTNLVDRRGRRRAGLGHDDRPRAPPLSRGCARLRDRPASSRRGWSSSATTTSRA